MHYIHLSTTKLQVAALLIVMGIVAAPTASASHIDWDARRAEREAARLERVAEREARRLEREAERAQEDEPQCTCSAKVSFVKPELNFGLQGLAFTPRVNVDIRLKGDTDGPKHTVGLKYSGSTANESDDVAAPAGISFSGEKTLISNAQCEGRWKMEGIELERLTLPGLTRTLLTKGQKVVGSVTAKAEVLGCGEMEETRAFSFTLRDGGKLSTGIWRTVR